ncbi:expressed protein [Arabidopsis lyrata subsp. lyrata]|uniref:Expressed protein n=1 Tax=Arabidopsis lyrata subsp. lyrata TaxID=81972 RepID=D7KTX5_ARALL|nr:expressed protein [Arabidopsis lyrata subsp. lyrata]
MPVKEGTIYNIFKRRGEGVDETKVPILFCEKRASSDYDLVHRVKGPPVIPAPRRSPWLMVLHPQSVALSVEDTRTESTGSCLGRSFCETEPVCLTGGVATR